jgi:hypothetical protein
MTVAMWLKWHLGVLAHVPVLGYFVRPLHDWSIRTVDDHHEARRLQA